MADASDGSVTRIIRAAGAGDAAAAEQLLPLVYDELRRIARARMARLPAGLTLQPTDLVHEAYLRLARKGMSVESRRHFFFAAGRAMRDILVERARARTGPKRGGGRRRVELTDALAIQEPPADEILALQEALAELEREDPLKGQIVNLRYFVGMTAKETAEVLGLSERTVHRHWRFIAAWLKRRLTDGPA